ncbi:ABC transporter permease [Criibacterium bergeronii]|uniref:ABC transporter permease n=1 Tax=Criibacterium bergeronii TaxID=1871336 RepID=A0A371IMY5_9FIRM|nr:ABC transporter permease [Criibacterium bergeronii]MBS6063914.1 ABC transporter permease [Peptostreptococcaceae bacterium]RDY21796.1 ABC transporter permease [Criibacterium bergeronii]TRW24548.1 ABC transporter permease [Criibacterium bergeronii]
MGRYFLKRLLLMIPVIFVTSFLIYAAMNMTSGDVALSLAPENASDAQIELIRKDLGLDQPFIVRYVKYMTGMLKGDLGVSYITGKDVFKTYMQRLPATMELAITSVLVSVFIAIPLGIYTAIHQNTWKDNLGMVFALFGVSMPNFWLGLMLMLFFSLNLGWLPSSGRHGFTSVILPALTVGLGLAALITRTTRSSMLDVLRQDYMTTARAKGANEKRVIFNHGLKNALIPIITVIGMQLSNVLTGSVLAETVFSWPGVGRLIFDSISKRDTPMVTGAIIMSCVLMSIVNLLVDFVYAFFDPRIKAQYVKKK